MFVIHVKCFITNILLARSIGVSAGACAAFSATMVAYLRSGGWIRTDKEEQKMIAKEKYDPIERERRRRAFFRDPEQAKISSTVPLPEDAQV